MAPVPVAWVLRQREVSRLPPTACCLSRGGWVKGLILIAHNTGVALGCSPLGRSQRLVTSGRGTNPPVELEGKGAGAPHAPLHAFPIQPARPCIAWLWTGGTTMLGLHQVFFGVSPRRLIQLQASAPMGSELPRLHPHAPVPGVTLVPLSISTRGANVKGFAPPATFPFSMPSESERCAGTAAGRGWRVTRPWQRATILQPFAIPKSNDSAPARDGGAPAPAHRGPLHR